MTGESESLRISAIVVAYDRLEATITTLEKLEQCSPPPDEILLHIDGGRMDIERAIRAAFPQIRIFVSDTNVGPGGGRNLLLEKASGDLIASFDDDSYPMNPDYFSRLQLLGRRFPQAAVFAANIKERGQPENQSPMEEQPQWVADFVGCGCAYQRRFFHHTQGYVPMAIAYGMEEADLALRIHARGGKIRYSPELAIYHDTDLSHHCTPQIACFQLTNTALLPFLRYPLYLFPIAALQFLHKLFDTLRRRRFQGALLGLASVVPYLFRHRRWRRTIPGKAILSFLQLRRHPRSA